MKNKKGERMNKEEINIIIETLESFEKDNYISKKDARLSKQGNQEASKRVQETISKNIKVRDIIKKLKKEVDNNINP
tara:strand:- start:267 stop:497 length:231 start_codon:yes stop_codon:yes gene_type:complete